MNELQRLIAEQAKDRPRTTSSKTFSQPTGAVPHCPACRRRESIALRTVE